MAVQRANDDVAPGLCKPIFVVGHYRSGTTWVTNLLEAHPDVYTPTHPKHHGQHESAFFSDLLPYCAWGRTGQDRIAMRAIFECSDYWHLLFPQDPPNIEASEKAPEAYFRECMDLAAQRRGCSHWLEKTPTHTLLLGYLIKAYPDARFVAVERSSQDVVRSYMFNSADPYSIWGWATRAMMVVVFQKVIHRYRSSVVKIRYEDLCDNSEKTLQFLYRYLDLRDSGQSGSKWPANSSFKQAPVQVALHFRVIVTLVTWTFSLLPDAWCERIAVRRFYETGSKTLPSWFFHVFGGRYGGFHE